MPRLPGTLTLMLLAIFAWLVAAPAAQAPSGKSAATITGAFADSCRDFAAHSSKDISYVELRYVAGPVIRNESINSHDHTIDGGAGDEIGFATVKSGTTIEEFACVPSNRAPTAVLEIQTPVVDQPVDYCYDWFGTLLCEISSPRTVWTRIPANSDNLNLLYWGCGALPPYSLPPYPSCPSTFSFRGTASSDPDGDITSWSLDFGDGTSVSGNWSTSPPAEVVHEYPPVICSYCYYVVTLTVTDSAGQSHSNVILIAFVDQHPD